MSTPNGVRACHTQIVDDFGVVLVLSESDQLMLKLSLSLPFAIKLVEAATRFCYNVYA